MDLIPLIANLRLKYKLDCLAGDSLTHLTETSRYVYETANMNLISGQPYVARPRCSQGRDARAGGPEGCQHIRTRRSEAVGNSRRILVSELSGVSNIAGKAGKKFELDNDKETLKKVLERVKTLENEGYQFEAAEASFRAARSQGDRPAPQFFDLDHYRVSSSSRKTQSRSPRRRSSCT
jgi:2-isopropylmalate synthase